MSSVGRTDEEVDQKIVVGTAIGEAENHPRDESSHNADEEPIEEIVSVAQVPNITVIALGH